MVDISKHPLHKQIYELCQAIEVCGASPELTKAVSLATDLHESVDEIIDNFDNSEIGFTSQNVTVLADGSAVFFGFLQLPKDHWLYAPREEAWDHVRDTRADKPKPILTHELRPQVVAAIRYAVRGATMNGTEKDFDPDALVQNAVVALCGNYT